ncbi:PepSY domain-containing protein [Pedobacter sp. MC2016-14]|uniref:PepSY domain-containing protein n=1 Tax=Pedobacter sp. MC2016-14 TaxID=2897327 RepID=UPI001E2BF68F|nr:PepSY domain-containing protein [Pedobacter sp. MC2016-14]MCD0488654.1 PepSY domain-containing protein [Pedobacter sp. MC2016-14]
MTISIWRYSHLALAVSSFLLLILASITGIILSFEPISEKLQPYRAAQFNQLTLAETLPALRKTYPDISGLSVDANEFVQVTGSDNDGNKLLAYVDPQTGKILGVPGKKNPFFQWVTALHRSLFLHETGRFFIGLTAFLLLLITVSGTILIIQRQRGIKRFFTKIVRDNFAQYYHVVLSRWSLIPILIISITGTYLSLARFGFVNIEKTSPKIDFDSIKDQPERKATDFEIFKNTKLSEVESVEFPFSEDVEDYYTLKLKDAEIAVNQITGDIIAEVKYPAAIKLTNLSLSLHTGRASILWAIVLAGASVNILFFIYSGFAMTLKRRASRTKNKYTAAESKFIILVGSENGSSFAFAKGIHQALIKAGEKSYLTELNNYTVFPKAEYMLILTATYGLGDAPTNASKFKSLLEKYPQSQFIRYAVLGFGSHAYPDFCKFAFEVNNLLSHQNWTTPLTDIHTVDDKSPADFNLWIETLSQQEDMPAMELSAELYTIDKRQLETLKVSANTPANELIEGTFTLSMQFRKRLRVTSGDLLAIYPANDHRERLYSIGIVDKQIRLSVRLQPEGLGSGFLHRLQPGEKITAKVIKNEHFHFPLEAPEILLISNGTGIAPYLGMISQNNKKIPCWLYCGFRQQASYNMYKSLLETNAATGNLTGIHTAFSREGEKLYVSHLLSKDQDKVAALLQKGGVIMICGSLAMEKDVMDVLEVICQTKMDRGISFYQSRNQIRTDCY